MSKKGKVLVVMQNKLIEIVFTCRVYVMSNLDKRRLLEVENMNTTIIRQT